MSTLLSAEGPKVGKVAVGVGCWRMAGSCCNGGDLDCSGESWIVEFEALKQIPDGTPFTEKGKRFAKYGKMKINQQRPLKLMVTGCHISMIQ